MLFETRKIFIASTGDASVNMIIRAKDLNEAVLIANNEFSEENDELDFVFEIEHLEEVSTIGKSETIEVF
jgi:uncharacterized Zn finger protein